MSQRAPGGAGRHSDRRSRTRRSEGGEEVALTAAEVANLPERVRSLDSELLALPAEMLPVTVEALALAAGYHAHGILEERFRNDMLHIALASIADVDVLVSWNFRHTVRLDKIRLFSAVNLEFGYKPLVIYSPKEITGHGED